MTMIAMASDSESRITARSMRTLSPLPTYWLARSPIGLGDPPHAPFSSAAWPKPIVAA